MEEEIQRTEEATDEKEKGVQPARKDPVNFGILFIGMLSMALGIAYLLDISGVLYVTLDLRLSYFLPLVIIFIGLSLLSRSSRSSYFIGFIATFASLFIIGSTVVESASVESTRHVLETQSIIIPKAENTDQALLYVTMGDGDITIKAGAGDDLVRGEFTSNFTYLIPEDGVEDTIQGVSLGSEGTWQGFGKQVNSFDLTINETTPLRLYLGAATATMDIDLTGTRAEYVGIRAQGADIAMTFDAGVAERTLEFNTPESILSFTFPQTTGIEIRTTPAAALERMNGLEQTGEFTYRTTGFSEASEIVVIKLVAPVSELTLGRQ